MFKSWKHFVYCMVAILLSGGITMTLLGPSRVSAAPTWDDYIGRIAKAQEDLVRAQKETNEMLHKLVDAEKKQAESLEAIRNYGITTRPH